MTRRDYIALANVMARNRPCNYGTPAGNTDPGVGLWLSIRDHLVKVLESDNPHFDADRFYANTEAKAFV